MQNIQSMGYFRTKCSVRGDIPVQKIKPGRKEKRKEGRTDGRKEIRTEGRTEGRKEERREGRKEGIMKEGRTWAQEAV